MVRSRLPVPSLLGLFAALLMLPPVLLKEKTGAMYDVPVNDPWVQEALKYAVYTYNKKRSGGNYFKILRVLETKAKEENRWIYEYQLKLEMVETSCKKRDGVFEGPGTIKKCEILPGNPQKKIVVYDVDINLLGSPPA